MKRTKRFDVHYGQPVRTHKYSEEWETLDLFCPKCGKKDVWHQTCVGDYYVGEIFVCTACKSQSYMPNGLNGMDDDQGQQRLKKLLS